MKLVIDFSLDSDKRKLFEILKTRKPKKYIVEIKEAKEKRSNLQNNLYWVYMGILSEHTGYTPEEVHIELKEKFLGYYEKANKANGEVKRFIVESKKLDTLEFTKYIESVRLYAMQDLDCYLPLPQEYEMHQIELNVKYLDT